ncbi:MAG: type-F conjugative transfer system protein TraW [Brevundimonas sp.]
MKPLHVLKAIAFFAFLASASPASAGDLGVMGHTFAISEHDILEVISNRLKAAQREGRFEELNREFQRRVEAKVERPTPAPVRTTSAPRTWLFDPSITVDKDYSDHRGRVFARAGQRINPFERLPGYDRVLLFIDGDDERQVEWALGEMRENGEHRTRIILTNGAPLELMRRRQVQFFFDQEARLVTHFQLQQVPARITKEGNQLRISELKPW